MVLSKRGYKGDVPLWVGGCCYSRPLTLEITQLDSKEVQTYSEKL